MQENEVRTSHCQFELSDVDDDMDELEEGQISEQEFIEDDQDEYEAGPS